MGNAFRQEVDVIKDIKDKQGIQNELNEIQKEVTADKLDNFDFKEFDNQIEQSFQTFLKSGIDSRKGSDNMDNMKDMQDQFNTWLDREFKILDNMKYGEIAQKIIKPITFELNTQATIVGLEDIQRSLGDNKLNMTLFSKEINTNHIKKLFNLKFEGRDELLTLLNNGNVEKFQRIIADLSDTDEKKCDKATKALGPKGVDGQFGKYTVQAFERYIADHLEKGKISMNSTITQLDVSDVGLLKQFVEQNANQGVLNLKQIQTITPEVAQELANFKGTIDLSGLTYLNSSILTILINSNATVIFPHGKLEKKVVTIDGNTIPYTIDNLNTICNNLIKGTVNSGQSSTNPGNSSQGSNRNGTTNSTNDANRNKQALHEGFNYAKSVDESEIQDQLPKDEKEAIKLITVGTKAYWLARAFRAKGFNAASSLVDKDYDPMRNKPERLRLKALRAGLESCLKDGSLDTKTLTDAFLKGGKGDLKDLNTLYKDFKAGKFDNFPYLERVMELIDDCFMQGGMIDTKGNRINTFKDLYKDILIGDNSDLLVNKEKNIDKWSLDEIKRQLNDLEEDIIGDTNKDKLTDEYKSMTIAMANIQTLLRISPEGFEDVREKFSFTEGGKKESIFSLEQVKFACCLCDLNTDGRVDVADKDTKTGQELFNLIVDAQIEGQDAMANILEYALNYANNCGHQNTLKKLQNINDFPTANQKLDYIAKNPIIMQYLREMLTKASVDNVRAIVLKGSAEKMEQTEEEKKFWEYMMNPEVGKAVDERFDDALKEIEKELNANKELSDDQRKQILEDLKKNPETLKRTLRTAFSGYLALGYQTGSIGVGGTILNFGEAFNSALLSNFAIGAHGGLNGNGATFGLGLAGGKSWQLNDRWQFTAGGAAGGGYSFGEGGGRSWAVPVTPGLLYQINNKNLTNTLDVRSAKYIGGNAILMYGSAGLGVGGALQYKRDMLEGIEQTSANMGMKLLDSLINAYNSSKGSKFLDKSNFTKVVFDQLKKDFPNTDDETLKSSTLLLYTGISYYLQKDNGEGDNLPSAGEMGKIFDNVSKDFTLNWKNTAVASLNGDVDLTGVSAGVVWVDGGFAPAGGIQITNYENLFAHDTQESRARYESSLYSELGMDLHEQSLDNDGYISLETVNYLNKKLSIFFPRGDVPDIELTNDNPHTLFIPRDLCKYIDISCNKNLDNHIKRSTNAKNVEGFYVPANMRIGLSTYIGGGTMRANLILGDNKKSSDDTLLTSDMWNAKLPGEGDNPNPTDYVPDNEKISLNDVNQINAKLADFLKANPDFPLRSCERANGEQIAFNITNSALENVSLSSSTLFMQGGKILVPGNPSGELKVAKNMDGNYIVSFDADNTKKLSIKYEKHSDFKGEFDFHNDDLDNLFKNIERDLSTFDDNQKTLYSNFMENAMGDNYKTAFEKLQALLKDAGNKPSLKNFSEYLNSTSITDYDKMQVVDRFKAIFSYNKGLDTYKGVYNILTGTARKKCTYKTLESRYTHEALPLEMFNNKDYRASVLKELEKYNNSQIPRTQHSNLIGMTAFYRTDNQNARSYMLTQLGGTKVLGDVTIPIEQAYLEQTQNWLIDSLEKNDMHEQVLFEKIADTLKVDKDKIKDYDQKKIHNILSDALRGNPIDIGGKKATIKTNYVFYLLGECANESIGVEIEGVDTNSYADTVTVDYDVSGSSAGLYVRSQAADSQMGINANQHNYTIFNVFGGGETPEPKPKPGSGPVNPIEPTPHPGSAPVTPMTKAEK